MHRTHILSILFVFYSAVIAAQNNDSIAYKKWRLDAGYQNFRIIDENVSPLIYSANNASLGVQFQKMKDGRSWSLQASAAAGSNQSKRFGQREASVFGHYTIHGQLDSSTYVINPGLSFVQGNLGYTYLWKVNKSQQSMHLGCTINDKFTYTAIGADTWFLNQLSLSPVFKIKLINTLRSVFDAELSLPLASYLVHQPYVLDPSLPENSYLKAYLQTGSHLVTLNTYQEINVRLNLTYQLANTNYFGISWYFSWLNYESFPDRNLRLYANTFLITYTF